MFENKYCIIMAGGSGTRFWPVSTADHPKQFQDILGVGSTMIQQTFKRVKDLVPVENIFVITNKEYEGIVKEQLPEIKETNVIGEPMMRNTSACNILMAKKIEQLNRDAVLLVLPSDHLILNDHAFVQKINLAFQIAESSHTLVTIGIKPNRPETGFGYINFDSHSSGDGYTVNTFTEKPTLEKAKEFLDDGNYLWNSGMFIWSVRDILEAFQKHLPEMYEEFNKDFQSNSETLDQISRIYQNIESISIDKGILEKATNVKVIPADMGWSDLGSWTSIYENSQKDENNNIDNSKHVITYHSQGNIIHLENPNKVAIIDGLQDYIIVDTEAALLICPRAHDQEIKDYVNDLNKKEDTKHFA